MRIIEQPEETTLQEVETPEVKEEKPVKKNSIQEDLFDIAQKLYTIGNELSKLATKL
jgi:hypothetical protein